MRKNQPSAVISRNFGFCGNVRSRKCNKLSPNAATDAAGIYDVGVLPPGSYFVKADPTSAQPFADAFFDGRIDIALADPVLVLAGATTSAVDFSLQPPGAIVGVVRDDLGAPIGGIDLDLFDPVSGAKLAANAASVADGSYQFTALAPGAYHVRADPTLSQGLARTYYVASPTLSGADPVVVLGGSPTPGVDFALGPGAGISGAVVDQATGFAIPGAKLQFADVATLTTMDQTATSAADGSYTAGAFPPTDYLVLATPAPGDSTHVPTWFGDTTDIASATPVTLIGGSVTPNVVIALPEPHGLAVGLLAVLGLGARRRRRRSQRGYRAPEV